MAQLERTYERIANKYAKDVVNGRVSACVHVVRACQRHLDDLEKSKADDYPFEFNPTLTDEEGNTYRPGERVCTFAEFQVHIKGKWAGKPIELEPWQVFFLCVSFGWVQKSDGYRRFREIYAEIPRKNAKSTLGAVVGNYMAFVDNEKGSEAYSGATTEAQAMEVFRPAWLMIEQNPEMQEHFGLELSGTKKNPGQIYQTSTNSFFKPIIGKPGDGASPHCALIDEYHEHKSPEQYDTMKTGMGARTQPMLVVITTAGTNLAGPCFAKSNQVKKVLEGLVGFDNDRLFGIIYTIDTGEAGDDDWTSEAALRKANPNFGVSVFRDYLLGQVKDAIQDSTKQNTCQTKHFNIWCNAGTAYFNMQKLKACVDQELRIESFKNESCWPGIDLASKIDIAALIPTFKRQIDGQDNYFAFCNFYLPEERTFGEENAQYADWARRDLFTLSPGARNDFSLIEDDLKDVARTHQVEEVPHDPWNAVQFVNNMHNEGLPMVEFTQTVNYMSEPMKELKASIAAGTFHYDGNPILTWMFSNVMARVDKKDNVFPYKESEDQKIDGVVALIMGIARAMVDGSVEEEEHSEGFVEM